MPYKAKRPCREPGCTRLSDGAYCEEHRAAHEMQRERARGNSAERGYNARWRRERLQFLREHPLCAECFKRGRLTPATEVDHITPHRGDPTLFWNQSNWQPLCKPCHSTKTAREDGAFGNPMKR